MPSTTTINLFTSSCADSESYEAVSRGATAGMITTERSKSELLIESASYVLRDDATVEAFVSWLQFFVQEWGA